MDGIKTFPVIMSKDFHRRMKGAAYVTDKNMKDFAMEAIEKAVKEVENKQASK